VERNPARFGVERIGGAAQGRPTLASSCVTGNADGGSPTGSGSAVAVEVRLERHVDGEVQALAAYRVGKREAPRMQLQSFGGGLRFGWCVEGAAQNGMTERQKVNAQLMGAAGEWFEFEPRHVALGVARQN